MSVMRKEVSLALVVEVRDKYLIVHRIQFLQQTVIWPQTATVSILRNPD